MSYIILRGRWCKTVVLNADVPCDDNSDAVKESFYEELGRVFDQFPRYDMKILLSDLKAKIFSNRQLEIRVHTKLIMIME
jgi:hypothetical protein